MSHQSMFVASTILPCDVDFRLRLNFSHRILGQEVKFRRLENKLPLILVFTEHMTLSEEPSMVCIQHKYRRAVEYT